MSVDTTAFREFGPKFAVLVARLWVRTFSKVCADEYAHEDIRT